MIFARPVRWRRTRRHERMLVSVVALLVLLFAPVRSHADTATAQRGMVATVHPLATAAGQAAFENGGNAADAAIAAALMLGVVDGNNSGIGGGCFIVVRKADGTLLAIDGRETAPRRATRDMFLRDGKPDASLSTTGPLAVATPGALAAYAKLVEVAGKSKLAQLFEPAIEVAAHGFVIDGAYAGRLTLHAEKLRRFEGTRSALLRKGGQPYKAGETLRQEDLARTYRAIAEQGIDWFYQGKFAQHVGQWMADNGGILSREDFADYRPLTRSPVLSTYRELTIVGYPPPSSGGVHVAQVLNILEPFDLAGMSELQRTHIMVEAMKRAFADRAHWLGDPDFAKVPRGLIDKGYALELAATIDPKRATPVAGHGQPPRADEDFFGKHTTHIAAADAEGNWVAITSTLNTTFGSKVVVPGTGVVLNNQMDDFSAAPGVPNAFGLVGAETNAIAPGKRPLSSMSPTIVLKNGSPVMTLGAAGGPKIITAVLQTIVNRFDLGMSTEAAVAKPRFHHQWVPDKLMVEPKFPAPLAKQLEDLGHVVIRPKHVSRLQAISREAVARDDDESDEDVFEFVGVSDPRVPGKAGGH